MIFLIIITLIAFQSLVYCSDLPHCPRPHNLQSPQYVPELRQDYRPDSGHQFPPLHEPPSEHFYNQCGESCRGPPPKIGSIVFSPVGLNNVLEYVELICEPTGGNRIVKLIIENIHLQYNSTCNGVLAGHERNPGTIYNAIIKTKGDKEILVPLKASSYRYAANHNMGTESFTESAELKNGICDGAKLSSYSVWVADDPTQGCCSTGVRNTRAVYYKLEIRGGNCCTVCQLLAANDRYETPLHN